MWPVGQMCGSFQKKSSLKKLKSFCGKNILLILNSKFIFYSVLLLFILCNFVLKIYSVILNTNTLK